MKEKQLKPNFNIVKPNIEAKDLIKEVEKLKSNSLSPNLKMILATQAQLRRLKEKDIQFSDPILAQNGNAVIFPHTINVIQGQAGVHKSRLAENICSALLKRHDCENELLGFKRSNFEALHTIVYVDTERNLSEQLPYALQSIQIKAGFAKSDHPDKFDYLSLLQFSRKDRFEALKEYLEYIRKNSQNPLFMVLDVSTDCIEDFNNSDKSLELIDLMNIAINDHNAIFLCLIHENPKSDKARGHFGTELMNKASTVMQVGFEKDSNGNDSELIRVKYLKCRSTARHTPFHIKYSQEAKGLVLASPDEIAEAINNKKQKADIESVIDCLERILGEGISLPRQELVKILCEDLEASLRTIETRLSDILSSDHELFDNDGKKCTLLKENEGKITRYKLNPI